MLHAISRVMGPSCLTLRALYTRPCDCLRVGRREAGRRNDETRHSDQSKSARTRRQSWRSALSLRERGAQRLHSVEKMVAIVPGT